MVLGDPWERVRTAGLETDGVGSPPGLVLPLLADPASAGSVCLCNASVTLDEDLASVFTWDSVLLQ